MTRIYFIKFSNNKIKHIFQNLKIKENMLHWPKHWNTFILTSLELSLAYPFTIFPLWSFWPSGVCTYFSQFLCNLLFLPSIFSENIQYLSFCICLTSHSTTYSCPLLFQKATELYFLCGYYYSIVYIHNFKKIIY